MVNKNTMMMIVGLFGIYSYYQFEVAKSLTVNARVFKTSKSATRLQQTN